MSGTLSPLFSWRSAICDSDLPPTTRHVALTLSLHMSERGDSCFPSIPTLMRESGLARGTVCDHMKKLEEEGWIERQPGGGRASTRYTARIPAVREMDCSRPGDGPEVVIEDAKVERPSPAVPSKAEKDSVWDSLEAVFGKPTTPQHRSRFGRVQKELLADTSLAPADVAMAVALRAARYRAKWPGIDLTLEAFAKHWPDLRGGSSGPMFVTIPGGRLTPEQFRAWRSTASREAIAEYQHRFDVDDNGESLADGF